MRSKVFLEGMYMLPFEKLMCERNNNVESFTYNKFTLDEDITNPHFRDELEERIKNTYKTVDSDITFETFFPEGVDYCH